MKVKSIVILLVSAVFCAVLAPNAAIAADGADSKPQSNLTADSIADAQSTGNLLVTQEAVKNPFRVSSVSTSKKAYRAGNTLVLRMRVSGAKPQSCGVELDSGEGWYSSGIDYNEKTGLYEFRWKVTNQTELGKYKVDSIVLTDEKGNEFKFYNSRLHSGSGKSYVNMSKANFAIK